MVRTGANAPTAETKRPDPRYRFIMNTYPDLRCSMCPECRDRTVARKVALACGIQETRQLVNLNMNCPYCRRCDILIAHKDKMDAMLSWALQQPIGDNHDDYIILGTLDAPVYRKAKGGKLSQPEVVAQIRMFLGELELHYTPAHWGPADGR
jgi:hypothetical protein